MESLDEVNKKLDMLIAKVEKLEKAANLESAPLFSSSLRTIKFETSLAAQILRGYTTIDEYRRLSKDDITLAIIAALEKNRVMNILQLTDEVRRLRGKSSRRIVRKKLEELAEKNVVEEVVTRRGRGFALKENGKEDTV